MKFYLWVDYSSLHSVNSDKVYVMISRERSTSATSLVYVAYVMLGLSILVHLQDNNVNGGSPGSSSETHSKQGNGKGVRETRGAVKAGSHCGELGISIYWRL